MKTKSWLVGIGLFVGLALAVELLLRAFNSGLPPDRFCPDGSPHGEFRYQLRNRYLDTTLEDVSKYIICLGDSWTYGLGVAEKETWPVRLETIMQLHDPNVRVVNAATVGCTAADAAALFARIARRFRADRAVIFVGAQDVAPLELLNRHPLGDPFQPRSCPRPKWRFGHEIKRRRLAFQLRLSPPDPPDEKSYLPRRSSVAEMQTQVFRIAALAEELKVKLVFVTYPALLPGARSTPYLPLESRYNFIIRMAAEAMGAGLCDLEKRWGRDTEDFLLPWMLWPHPNEKGHSDIARAVAEVL